MSKDNKAAEEVEEGQGISMQDYITEILPHNILFGEFSDENYLGLVHDLNTSKDFLNRQIYLQSYGGVATLITPIKNMIEESGVKLVASQYIASCAFILFFTSFVRKEILDDTLGMFHYPYYMGATVHPNDAIKFNSAFEKFQYDGYDFGVKFMRELLNITDKQHKMLLKGGELCFTTKELKKLLKKSNKMLGIQ